MDIHPIHSTWFWMEYCRMYTFIQGKRKQRGMFQFQFHFQHQQPFLLFVYLFISTCLICCTDIILNIIVHKALLLIYHIVDIAMLTATCKCTKVEQGLNSSYVIYIYSFFDVIQSCIHFVIMVFVLCFRLLKCTRPIKIYSEKGQITS